MNSHNAKHTHATHTRNCRPAKQAQFLVYTYIYIYNTQNIRKKNEYSCFLFKQSSSYVWYFAFIHILPMCGNLLYFLFLPNIMVVQGAKVIDSTKWLCSSRLGNMQHGCYGQGARASAMILEFRFIQILDSQQPLSTMVIKVGEFLSQQDLKTFLLCG